MDASSCMHGRASLGRAFADLSQTPHDNASEEEGIADPHAPGASAVPAKREPHMTVEAPRHSAFAMCPEFWMPPSAIVGTPCSFATRDTWYTAAACPRPTAHTCGRPQRER